MEAIAIALIWNKLARGDDLVFGLMQTNSSFCGVNLTAGLKWQQIWECRGKHCTTDAENLVSRLILKDFQT